MALNVEHESPGVSENPQIITEQQPVVPETLQQIGVSSPPTKVDPVLDEKGQQIVASVPNDDSNSVVINATSTQSLTTTKKKGKASDAKTWKAVYFLRLIKQALMKGVNVLFKPTNP